MPPTSTSTSTSTSPSSALLSMPWMPYPLLMLMTSSLLISLLISRRW
jgi:hypothetical protein